MSSAFRNFLVVFLLALLGFGILGHFVITVAIPALGADEEISADSSLDGTEDETPDASASVGETSEDEPVGGNKYNFAFLCFDVNDKLAGVYIVHTDDGYKTNVSVSVPGSASVENNGAYCTLAQLYEDEGKDFLISKLYYLTGCRIDENASIYAVDREDNGRDAAQLSTFLRYTYKLDKGFEYPNPDYNRGEVISTESTDTSYDNEEFITVEAGSYALNGETGGVANDKMLLDTEYNENAFDIYRDMITRMLGDASTVNDPTKQAKIAGYLLDKSFRDYSSSGAGVYLFNNYVKAGIDYSGSGGAWDEIREAVKALEKRG